MKTQVQIALLVAGGLYLLWGIGFMSAPQQVHHLMSAGAYDVASVAMLTSSLFAFVMLFVLAAGNPARDMVIAAATALLFLGGVTAIMMLTSEHMLIAYPTVLTMIASLVLSIFLFLSQTEALANMDMLSMGGKAKRGRVASVASRMRSGATKRKTSKKKTTKKAKKKASKTRKKAAKRR